MKWAISSLSFPDVLQKKIEAAAAAGFVGVEIFHEDLIMSGVPIADMARFARELGVEIVSLQSLRDYEGAPPAQRDWNRRRAARMLDLAAAIGAGMLIVCSNTRADAIDDAGQAAADLAELADMAATRGLKIGYEALSTGRHVRRFDQAAALVARAGRPNLGLVLSVAHTVFAGAGFDELERLDPVRIFLVHLADVPDIRMDPQLLSGNFRLFPGQGDLPLADLYRRLAAMGYQGPISLEIFNEQMRGLSPAEIATDGMRAFHLLADGRAAARGALRGVAFVEIAAFDADRDRIVALLKALGFAQTHRHRSKHVGLWRRGGATVILNEQTGSLAHSYFLLHGTSVCAIAYVVDDLAGWLERLKTFRSGAISVAAEPGELDIPAIRAFDGSQLFFLDSAAKERYREVDFVEVAAAPPAGGMGAVDHFSQAVGQAEFYMAQLFYRAVLGFEKGRQVGLLDPHGAVQSRVMRSADGAVRMAINASSAANSTTQRFLGEAMGAGYQHIAFACDDVFAVAGRLDRAFVLRIPPTYYDILALRFDLDPALIERMRACDVLYDEDAGGRYFQLYTTDVNGLFLEIVQRDGYDGFGAVNAPVRMAAQTRDDEEAQTLIATFDAD
ncbi:MAG: sugar phosphate isomerase/epimerase and 4-hydroxyphenylpyruvate domain-containing protein [Methylobacteriaceae bacterium]|nr:sugar phosphate isomerase/epimerase and 4-hydroxyphenylpyruvate domain-containing protein [Methylobacteriaceae bacterium]